MPIQLKPLLPEQLDEFKSLLGSTDFGGCYCAVWTSYGTDWATRCADKNAPNFFSTAERVNNGKHAGSISNADI